jgi:DNA-binding transcriptional MerR regulator
MESRKLNLSPPVIPARRFFTIADVSELCGVKAHVLRYWEQEFSQLSPAKRSKRRYYQHHEVVVICRIKALLYDQGLAISAARTLLNAAPDAHHQAVLQPSSELTSRVESVAASMDVKAVKREINEIIALLNAQ